MDELSVVSCVIAALWRSMLRNYLICYCGVKLRRAVQYVAVKYLGGLAFKLFVVGSGIGRIGFQGGMPGGLGDFDLGVGSLLAFSA